ncbi:MAG: D-TA family PLP-dependent enzyme [Ginsengibacter sp.]
MEQEKWFQLNHPEEIDSPALLIYKDRVAYNIQQMISIAGNAGRLMPHVKTNKIAEIVQMQIDAGIHQFKCATIAEAEMLAHTGATEILLAYQLNRTKAERYLTLIKKYPTIQFSSLVDNSFSAVLLNELFAQNNLVANVFIDVDAGMHRTGILPGDDMFNLFLQLHELPNIKFLGLHLYDGHQREPDFELRKKDTQLAFEKVEEVRQKIISFGYPDIKIIAGGTPTFTVHVLNKDVYCSPGTCVLWDHGYHSILKEQPFQFAALIITRVISKPMPGLITTDLGHKSVAAENPIGKRIFFLNLDDYEVKSQSEEHLVMQVKEWERIKVGDLFYGVPYHICPTVALFDEANIIENGDLIERWEVVARRKKITI